MDDATAQRSRDLECDRLLSAGLCMASAAMAASRHFPRIDALAGLFEPHGAGPVLAPIIVLGGVLSVAVVYMVAASMKGRAAAGACLALGALFAAFTVPYAHQGLALFYDGAGPSKAGMIVAFVVFGLVAALAADDHRPSQGHLLRSVGITIVAMLIAALDGGGIFSCILMVMSFLFFTLWRRRTPS